ncbi:MAG: hypothetical protein ACP5UV_07225, partial [Thermoplasmata archaeon]
MRITALILLIILALLLAAPAYASGYGTSDIVLSSHAVSVDRGGSATVNYKVNLVSGSTWGTTLTVTSSGGITVSLSNPSADPTFSGTATISASSTVAPGNYTITFAATGDDPSSTSSVLVVDVLNTTQTSVPPPVSVIKVNYDPYVAGGLTIAFSVVLAFLAVAFLRNYSSLIRYAGFSISAASSIYLIAFDSFLRSVAYSHYIGLIAYFVLDVVFFALTFTKSPLKKTS